MIVFEKMEYIYEYGILRYDCEIHMIDEEYCY